MRDGKQTHIHAVDATVEVLTAGRRGSDVEMARIGEMPSDGADCDQLSVDKYSHCGSGAGILAGKRLREDEKKMVPLILSRRKGAHPAVQNSSTCENFQLVVILVRSPHNTKLTRDHSESIPSL